MLITASFKPQVKTKNKLYSISYDPLLALANFNKFNHCNHIDTGGAITRLIIKYIYNQFFNYFFLLTCSRYFYTVFNAMSAAHYKLCKPNVQLSNFNVLNGACIYFYKVYLQSEKFNCLSYYNDLNRYNS